jgi:hypothetical protein
MRFAMVVPTRTKVWVYQKDGAGGAGLCVLQQKETSLLCRRCDKARDKARCDKTGGVWDDTAKK